MANGGIDPRVNAVEESKADGIPKTKGSGPQNGFATSGHKRSLSGSILSKLSFLAPSQDHEDVNVSPSKTTLEDKPPSSPRSPGGAMASAVQQKKTRKRKGSLRKTALLGTKLLLEGKDRHALNIEQIRTPQAGEVNGISMKEPSSSSSPESPEDMPTPRNTHFPRPDAKNSSTGYTTIPTSSTRDITLPFGGLLRAPTFGDSSTTDEDDLMTLQPIANSSTVANSLRKPPVPAADSYFPLPSSSLRHRSRPANSPLAALPTEPLPSPEEWDYSETEWWGWVMLAVTWIVFVIGMGSCFEVWSWAWDVGETPYAPPELEDDPTLPIVGYYPALIILTGVMAWVWVVVAWVGMKYFKHAKISGEEG